MIRNFTKVFALLFFISVHTVLWSQSWQYAGPSESWPSTSTSYYLDMDVSPSGVPFIIYSDYDNSYKGIVKTFDGVNWNIVGNGFVSPGGVDYTQIKVSPTGVPFVVYSDGENGYKLTVKRLNGGNWEAVGTPLSQGNAYYNTLEFSTSGVPFVAYSDYGLSYKASVKSFDGANWNTIGTEGFTVGETDYLKLKLNQSGVPHLVFQDYGNSYKATVMKYTGSTWTTVGVAGFSTGTARYTDIAFKGNVPYVVFEDVPNSYKATVMSFSGTSWALVGNSGFSASSSDYTRITFSPAGIPYVSFQDGDISSKFSVMSLSGSNWVYANKSNGITNGSVYDSKLLFSPNGTFYISYRDQALDKAGIMSFAGSNWQVLGTRGFTPNEPSYLKMTISPAGVPFIFYRDDRYGDKGTVMTFDGANWSLFGTPGFTPGKIYAAQYSNLALAFNKKGVPYVAYSDADLAWKAVVLSFSGTSWNVVGASGFTAADADFIQIAFDQNDVPYVTYKDYGNSSKISVMKYNGSIWNLVGTAGFSNGEADYTNIAFSPAGTPYVTYADLSDSSKIYVQSFSGSNWEIAGNGRFSKGAAYFTSIVFSSQGIPHVVYSDGGVNSARATVKRLSGPNWVNVGNEGFSAGGVDYPMLAFNAAGAPFVVYKDFGNNERATVMTFKNGIWQLVGNAAFSNGTVRETNIGILPSGEVFVSYQGWLQSAVAQYFSLQNQSIIGFNTLPNRNLSESPIIISGVTASSGLPVSFFSSDPSTASVSGNTITLLKVGVVTITAVQAGNGSFNSAIPVSQSFAITGPVTVPDTLIFTGLIANLSVPSLINDSQANTPVSIRVSNATLVSNVVFYYKTITENKWNSITLTSTGNSYTYLLTQKQKGEIGVECYFDITAINGKHIYSDTSILYTKYDQGTTLTPRVFGTDVSKYSLFAMPYDPGADSLVSQILGTSLGQYLNTKWRLYRYNSVAKVNEEYLNTFTGMSSGRGYWLIVKDPTTISIPQGKAHKVSVDQPFKIYLNQGWNLIGNPYPFNLTWKDVQAANPGLGGIVTYRQGFEANTAILNKMEGAYILASVAGFIKIPTVKDTTTNAARKAVSTMGASDAAGNWYLDLHIGNTYITSRLSAIGMHKNASDLYDSHDLPLLSAPFAQPEIKILVRENLILSRSVITPAPEFTWDIQTNTSDGKITWSEHISSQLPNEIWIYNPATGKAADMKKINHFPSGQNLKILYGTTAYVESKIATEKISISDIYPNPTTNMLSVDVIIPSHMAGKDIKYTIMDAIGNKVMANSFISNTLFERLQINTEGLAGGIYFIQIENKVSKFIINRQ